MAAKPPKKSAPVETLADAAVAADASTAVAGDAKPKTVGVRGPKGVELTAKITVLAGTNPKRAGTKAFDIFSKYVDGMSVSEFLAAAGEEATPNIVYDAKHGFIAVEGYKVEVLPKKEPRVAKEKVAKAPKVKAEKLPLVPVDTELARETVEEEA